MSAATSSWIAQTVGMGLDILERMERAVASVEERLLRATSALNSAHLDYAVVGGIAVASWVATIDEGAIRNTPNVDFLIRGDDLPPIAVALENACFVRDEVNGIIIFRDGHHGKPREAIKLLFAGEKTREQHSLPAPEIRTVVHRHPIRVIELDSLVLMKLVAFRLIDQVHLLDLIGVGLIDATWLPELSPDLAIRLKDLLDNPDS